MSLGPSGASTLQARSKAQRPDHPRSGSRKQAAKQADQATTAIGSGSDESTGRLESYFQAAMSRFLREQQTPVPQAIQNPGSQDVDMESTESPDPDHSHWEYDPDELDFPTPSRAAVATTTAGSTGSTMIQRVRISAISDLKEFSGKDQDEDRARAWVGKVKSAFLRDQASDGEKCLTFADLLSGSARNWYRQLPRSTRNKWSELLRSFQIQYCGFGISVARQYYHARKRSDESALEYLHRLNVAGLRARLKIKDGGPKEKREHVDHFIETLGDQDLADRLTLLRLPDADEREEVLRALDRAKNRMKKSAFGSSKYRQKASATPAPAVPAKHVRAVQIQAPDSGSDSSSDGSDSDGDDYRRIYMAGGGEQPPQAEQVPNTLDRGQLERRSADQVPRDHRSRVHADGSDRSRCSHCGSRKHTELGCWRRLTCQKCGKRGHPADHCLFVCRGCGELHDMGKCPMEEFYNWIRQWYNPTKHAGMLPEKAEKISDATVTVDLDPEVPQGYWKQQDPDLWFRPADGEDTTSQTPRSGRVEAYRRSGDPESPDLLPGESRGYWKQHSPGKWFRQAKITGKINNEKAILLLDTGAEVSIVDTAFARKVGCYIDRSQSQECVGIGDNVYTTEGRTRIKITLAGSLVYFFDIWVGGLSGQEAILGMDFMVPAGIRLDLADGSLCLPDEVRIQLSGRRQLYNDKARLVRLDQHLQLGAGESVELPLRLRISDQDKLWVTRGDLWVPTVTKGPGKTQYLQITNVGEKKLVLCRDERIGMWLAGDRIPRLQGFVTVGSRRYLEWQNLALQATTEAGPAKADPHGPRRRRWLSVPNPQSARLPKTCKSADLDTEDATGPGQGDPGLAVGDKTQGVPTAAASGCSTLAMQWEVVPEPSRAQITPVEAKSPGGGCGRGGLATRRPDPKVVPDSVCEPPRIWALKATTTSDDQDHALADMPRPDQDPQQAAEDLPSPDPSTGPGEVPTDQGPTLYAQGAEDPAGVGQADQPVVLSESNQGGNHPETGGGSANLTYGDKGQDADPAGTHASSDDQAGKGRDLHGGMTQEANQAPGSTAATNPLNADQAGSDPVEDEQVCIHESGDLHAEDVEAEMAVLPEVTVGTADVKIEDIQVGDPEINSPEEIERLRGLIWKRRHLLIGKGNALPPAARGVVCDIDVGDAGPIAQRVRKVAPQFREKLSDLIKGLLGAQIIKASISPWASPIVVIIKKNGVDIRLCIGYRLVNSLTRLMIYPMPLINDLLEDLDKDEEAWIAGLKKYLVGAAQDLTQDEARSYGNISMDYEVDLSDLLFYCHPTRRSEADRDGLMRLVIPETLQQDVLHHYHASLEGGHQGIGRTYQKIRDHFHWRGLYRSVQQYVGECVDCETGKGRPRIQGESPGNIQATYPFQIIAMDHIPSLPKSYKGNTELLIWVDLFTGYVIAKASASRTAQTIAESYEECVFRRFGASEVIRHDREPGFMSDFFRSFNRILGQRQRATMAYRPQANGTAERMVQTATRALKMIGSGETPFYLVHGWDPRSTLEATIPLGSTRRQDRDPRRWRYQIQRYYQQAREQVNEKLREAISDRADHHNEGVHPHQIEVGSRVWLYLDRVKEGYARKLAHLWHGPFRVAEKIGEYAARIELAGTEYRLFPVVHVSKLKLVKTFPDRPRSG
ncbi:reverse transcriptase [Phytophthora cinnamomi]|uniref:reverse transcriptase n=1 Tax=Phytophthora cinnamomi TaxID=4785 RepID=UPI00355A901D|nr:reverse transcriptase [Phytophthora cinnamomi]